MSGIIGMNDWELEPQEEQETPNLLAQLLNQEEVDAYEVVMEETNLLTNNQ